MVKLELEPTDKPTEPNIRKWTKTKTKSGENQTKAGEGTGCVGIEAELF